MGHVSLLSYQFSLSVLLIIDQTFVRQNILRVVPLLSQQFLPYLIISHQIMIRNGGTFSTGSHQNWRKKTDNFQLKSPNKLNLLQTQDMLRKKICTVIMFQKKHHIQGHIAFTHLPQNTVR